MIKPLAIAALFAAIPIFADTTQANTALQHGRVAEAETLLRATLQSSPRDPQAHQLLCRVFYAQDQSDRAIPECEAAAAAAPSDPVNQLWLGRAYGQKAEHAGPLTAFSLARKARTAFERAAPTNLEAADSLGQFYVAAPSIVGGGLDKARTLANTLEPQSPAAAHRLRALIAASAKDLKTAEAEYKAALPSPAAWMDLAAFYQTHDQPTQVLAAVRSGLAADKTHGPALVDAASILRDAKLAPDLQEQALRDYIASPAQSDAAPVFKAHLQLGRLLAQRGDAPAARAQYAAALALAPNFPPAQAAAKGAQ